MTNIERASRLSDADEAEIMRRAESDPDNPPATKEQLAHPMTFEEALPELAAAVKRGRGRPTTGNAKEHVTLRLSGDVVAYFRATGPGWQGRIDEVLKEAVARAAR